MSFWSLLKPIDINVGIENYKKTAGAVLLDVRSAGEYRQGHIEGSINLPLQSIDDAMMYLPDLSQPIYTYCLSGARSRQAASTLKAMGYTNVTNIGGIGDYHGKIVR